MIIVLGQILIDCFPEYERIGGAPFYFAYHLKKMGCGRFGFFAEWGLCGHAAFRICGDRILRQRSSHTDIQCVKYRIENPPGDHCGMFYTFMVNSMGQ